MLRVNRAAINTQAAVIYISALLMLFLKSISYGEGYELEIKSGISRDFINYEGDSADLVFRCGGSLLAYDIFRLNITALRDIEQDTTGCTWNLEVKNIAGCADFISGNYNLHFGSGLMMGRAIYMSRDPFTKKLTIAKDRTITLFNGGDQEYSLFGTVLNFHKSFDDINICFIPFFSDQRRYISAESFDQGYTDSSLFTLNSTIRRKGSCTEPVNIINSGGLIGLQALSLFNIQIYSFFTDLKGDNGKDILWDSDKYYGGSGVDLIANYGLFAGYADRNISLFIEPAASSIYNGGKITDYAVAYGAAVRNSMMNFSLKGKNCGRYFHSEYSSGSRTPERIWEAGTGITPIKSLETGITLYSEKNLVPAYNSDTIDGSLQYEFFMRFKTGGADLGINLKRREHYSDDRKDPLDQGNVNAGFTLTERLYFRARSSVQSCSGDRSYLAAGEIKYMFLDCLSLSLGYSRIIINGETPHYAVITPASEHSYPERFSGSVHGCSAVLRYKNGRDFFYTRFTSIKSGSECRAEAESGLGMVF